MSTSNESEFATRTTALAAALVLGLAMPAMAQTAAPAEGLLTKRVVLISVPDRRLAVLENGTVVARFPVAVGANVSPSPTGDFEVVSRLVNPTYYHKGLIVPSGKDSPVGTRWVGLNVKGYGIHGTNAPRSIGRAASHGCIRLRNRDMEKLFTMVRVGDVVSIRSERDAQIAQVFGEADETVVASVQATAPLVGQ